MLIRFRNNADTLGHVIDCIKQQTYPVSQWVGIDTGSTDGSARMLHDAGAEIHSWTDAYHHSRVLNFGMAYTQSELVLIESSHTALTDPQTIAQMVATLTSDSNIACVSGKWDQDPYYSDRISWQEICSKGLKMGSIYSNSMGMIRRSLWQEMPFDDRINGCEDYAWALHQTQRGRICARLDFPFDYMRADERRVLSMCYEIFRIGQSLQLPVIWRGARGSLTDWLQSIVRRDATAAEHMDRLVAWVKAKKSPLSQPKEVG